MRKKLLNNSLTNSISKGGVLYRPGEIPTLTKEQITQANLVSKLPRDFPFANWENMTARQQQQTISRSGLNPQAQWALLNSNVPLVALNQYNQAQDETETRANATKIATTLMNVAAQATATAKSQATVGKPTVSTPLQTTAQQRKLDMKQEEYETRFYEKQARRPIVVNTSNDSTKTPKGDKPVVDSRDAMEQKKDKLWEKIVVPTWREKREDEIWKPVKSREEGESFPEFNLFNVETDQPTTTDRNYGVKPNSKIIEMFNLGYKEPVQLKDGEFYYVEEAAVVGGVTNAAFGRVILFNEDKYAVYNYIGYSIGTSVADVPYNHVWSRGVVSNVYDIGDYCGSFLNGCSVTGAIGYSESVGRNSRGDTVISRSDGVEELFPSGSISAGYQWYSSQSDQWIYDTAPIEWADTLWDKFMNPHPYEA